jgi:glycosyltransferase-like protein
VRIALLTYSTRPRGSVVATLGLAEALAADGHAVDVWTLARGGDAGFFRPVAPAVQVIALPFPDVEGEDVGARVERSIATLGAALATARGPEPDRGARHDHTRHDHTRHDHARYDIVHAQDCISANAAPGCVRTVHHLDTFTTPRLRACHERGLRDPIAHVCVSRAVAAELADGWGIAARVIPNGVDAGRFAAAAGPGPVAVAARARWRAELGRYLLAVGGIEPRKGSLDLLTAYDHARAAEPGLALVIAGGETLFDYRPYRASFEEKAAELGIVPRVLGPVAEADLPALVAAADVFAFPSIQEGFGLAAMEALAAGVPVVARDLPVLREVFAGAVTFADAGEEFGQALVRAARARAGTGAGADTGTATSGGTGAAGAGRPDPAVGRRLADRHSWAAAAESHAAFYREILDRPAPG